MLPFRQSSLFTLCLVVLVFGTACSTSAPDSGRSSITTSETKYRTTGHVEEGKASWYSVRTNGGSRTASGERLRNDAPTAAHRTLPMGSVVKVTNLRNGKCETVRITDRGPFTRGRIIDVTIGTAEKLDMVRAGVVPVKVERLVLNQ